MFKLSRKAAAALLAGTVLLGAAAVPVSQVLADAPANQAAVSAAQRQFDPDKAAARLATIFGVDKNQVLTLYNQGHKMGDIAHAAFLSQAAQRPLADVLAMKTEQNTWQDVQSQLGLSQEQLKAERHAVTSRIMQLRFGIDANTAKSLLDQGQKPRDVAMAGLLAKNSGKNINDVIAMKTQDNKWADVAKSLGVNDQTFQQDVQQLHKFAHHAHHAWRHGAAKPAAQQATQPQTATQQ